MESNGDDQAINLFSGKGRKGSRMLVTQYQLYARFILSSVREHQPLKINELLDLAFEEYPLEDRNKLSLAVLQVKRDLEARDFIKAIFDVNRTQFILRTRKTRLHPARFVAYV